MRWKVTNEWEHYMKTWRDLCHSALIHNVAYQTRKENHTGYDTVAGPAYDQQGWEASIAQSRRRLEEKYLLCAETPDNEYENPADPRLFDEASMRSIRQWRFSEAVRVRRITEAALSNNGDHPIREVTARMPACVPELVSAQQVVPQGTTTAALHANHHEDTFTPDSNAWSSWDLGLDGSSEGQQYSQQPEPSRTRPSTPQNERIHQANLAPANVHGHTGAGEEGYNSDSLPPSMTSSSTSFDEEFAVARDDSPEAVGPWPLRPLPAAPCNRLTRNPEVIHLLSKSVIEAALDAGDYGCRMDMKSYIRELWKR